MPVYRDPFTKGNLVVVFEVKLPNSQWFLDNHSALEKLLPKKKDQIGKIINLTRK